MKKNILIVFCGMDGSGKTTIINHLISYFKNKDIILNSIHAHTYSISKNSFGVSEHFIDRWNWLLRYFFFIAFFDNVFTYFIRYVPELKKSPVILDRYFYDKIARLIYYHLLPPWFLKIYLVLLPRPDYIFFLDAKPKRINKRKNEMTIKELIKYRKIYLTIAGLLKAPVINTDHSIENSIKTILKYVNI